MEVFCYSLVDVLGEIKIYYIDIFFLDVEGVEMVVFVFLRDELELNSFMVDVWFIEYCVWDGKLVVYEKFLENLNFFRCIFIVLVVIVNIYSYLMMRILVMVMFWMLCV